jgi:hypothetical protein
LSVWIDVYIIGDVFFVGLHLFRNEFHMGWSDYKNHRLWQSIMDIILPVLYKLESACQTVVSIDKGTDIVLHIQVPEGLH